MRRTSATAQRLSVTIIEQKIVGVLYLFGRSSTSVRFDT